MTRNDLTRFSGYLLKKWQNPDLDSNTHLRKNHWMWTSKRVSPFPLLLALSLFINNLLFSTQEPKELGTVSSSPLAAVSTDTIKEPSDKPSSLPYYKEFNPHVDVTPSARGCPNSSGPYAMGSFIYWKSQLEKQDIAEKRTGQNALVQTFEQKELDFKYSPGFKLGLGYNFKRDFWDALLNWTSLHSNKSHKSLTSSSIISPTATILYLPLPAIFNNAILGGSVDAHWDMHFTTLDFELGRNFFISRNISFRPFLGLKADWIKWTFKNKYRNFSTSIPTPTGPFDVTLKEDNHGIGPRMGLGSRWILSSSNFSLFTNLAGSLLYTDLKGIKTFDILEPGLVAITKGHRHELKPVAECLIGLDWQHCIKKRCTFYLSVGYETQFWWDQTATDLNDSVFFFNGEIHALQALMFHGLTTSLRLDF